MTYVGDGNLDNVDDRTARQLIADWLEELADEPHMDLDKLMPYHRHLSERLKKIALAIDMGANRSGDTFVDAQYEKRDPNRNGDSFKVLAVVGDKRFPGPNRGGDMFEHCRTELGPDAFQTMYACNPVVGAKLSDTKPGALDLVKLKALVDVLDNPGNLKALVGDYIPDPPRLVQCDLLDGLKDEDGNPAAFIINEAAIQMPTMAVARTPGKTMNLVLMTPQFAELVAKAAAKHSIKIHIEGRKP